VNNTPKEVSRTKQYYDNHESPVGF